MCVSGVLKQHCLPIAFGMATGTLFSEASFVYVVFLVACIAINRGLVLIKMPLMAGLALGMKVPSEQRVLCMKSMVKRDSFPISLRMARLAFLTVTSFMFVVLLVARVTVSRGVLKGRSKMASFAFCRRVFAE